MNYFKANAHPLTALIESDWISMSFTMNYKIMTPHQPVRFDLGEPLFQAIPLVSNVCADLETASVSFQKLTDDPDLNRAYHEWDVARRQFHEQKSKGEVKPDDWQRDYFQGRDAIGREAATSHMIKVRPPQIRMGSPKPPSESVLSPVGSAASGLFLRPHHFGSLNIMGISSSSVREPISSDSKVRPSTINGSIGGAAPRPAFRAANSRMRGPPPGTSAFAHSTMNGGVGSPRTCWSANSPESVLEVLKSNGFAPQEPQRTRSAGATEPLFPGLRTAA